MNESAIQGYDLTLYFHSGVVIKVHPNSPPIGDNKLITEY